jgi:hypothetical protein
LYGRRRRRHTSASTPTPRNITRITANISNGGTTPEILLKWTTLPFPAVATCYLSPHLHCHTYASGYYQNEIYYQYQRHRGTFNLNTRNNAQGYEHASITYQNTGKIAFSWIRWNIMTTKTITNTYGGTNLTTRTKIITNHYGGTDCFS